jgi:hypothetical protein
VGVDINGPHRTTLEQIRLALEFCAPRSIEFVGFYDELPDSHPVFDWPIYECALFVGRRLSYSVVVFNDCHVALLVRDADANDPPRLMPRHEKSWHWVARIVLCLENAGIETVQTGDEPIVLRDNRGEHFLTIA